MEHLADPLGDRMVSTPAPPHRPLSSSLLFPNDSRKPDWKILQRHLEREGAVQKADVLQLVSTAAEILKKEPNLLEIEDPITVVGDIHGQFYDLLKILELGEDPTLNKYLFLGDYVDRGSFSLEVMLLLYALKINYPSTFILLRGNHEGRQMTTYFNFRTECIYKHDLEVYERFMESFDCLPLGCILNGQFLTVHGGISPELRTLEDMNRIYRFLEPPREGVFCDILWADPVDSPGGELAENFKSNSVRGCSYYYGVKAVNKFLQRNELLGLIRAHEAQLEGYKMHTWNGANEFPTVITIFSAANYCDVYNNKGAIIKFDQNMLNIQQYTSAPHPYLLPDFMDVFMWSIPFVIEKTMEMLVEIIKDKPGDYKFVASEFSKQLVEEIKEEFKGIKADSLRTKIKSVSRMMKVYKTLREESELIMQLKGMCPDNRLPRSVLLEGRTALESAVDNFRQAKSIDSVNEKLPEDSN